MNNELLTVLFDEYRDRDEWETAPEIDEAVDACYSALEVIRSKVSHDEWHDLEAAQGLLASAGQKDGYINGMRMGVKLARELGTVPLGM